MVKERKGEMSSGMCLKYKRCLGGVELSIFTCVPKQMDGRSQGGTMLCGCYVSRMPAWDRV